MEINYSLLQRYNPWWEDKNAIKQDEKIIEFSSQAIKYHPDFFIKEKFTTGVYTLLGPRQVGKSTTFKLFIKNLLLEKKVNSANILFFQCDAIKNFQELIKVLETYKESLSNKNSSYIFLDEISFIEEWPRAIKHLIDRGDLKNAIIFLSGSLSLNVKGGAELMPGRRGKKEKQDFMLLPLDFKKYAELLKNESSQIKFNFLLENPTAKILFSPELNKLYGKKTALESLFNQYLITGGFLYPINEFIKGKKITDATFNIYWQWIKGDLLKLERKETIFLEIAQEAIKHLGGTFSYNDIAKNISISSHVTVMDYLTLAEKFFILNIFHNIDLEKRLPALRKQKKLSFLDPFIFNLLNSQILGAIDCFKTAKIESSKYFPALTEGIISNFLKLKFLRCGFWNNKREIDFVGIEKQKTIGFEIKIQNKINTRDIIKLKSINQFDKIIVVSKNDFKEMEGILLIPYWMLLLL